MATTSPHDTVTAQGVGATSAQNVSSERSANSPKYCLLSLDGGGVRGLSTLYILKKLMRGLNDDRRDAGLPVVKPCDIFDLIAGTSTGGLIAIMLGRLKMSVEECIESYTTLMQGVFAKKENISPFGIVGGVKSRFSSVALRQAIEKVLIDKGVSLQEKLEEKTQPTCKVFVCTTFQKMNAVTRLRSYDVRGGNDIQPSIVEAALATTAAPTYFSEVKIGNTTFIDGAMGANNPAAQLELEAKQLFCRGGKDLQEQVACFLSLGTGHMDPASVSDRGLKHLVKALKAQALETNDTHENVMTRWQDRNQDCCYYRFNVERGLAGVTLAEFEKEGTVSAGTLAYLNTPEVMDKLLRCSEHLRLKQLPGTYLRDQEALRSSISELKNRGDTKRKLPSQQINYKVLTEALTLFKQALELSKKDPQSTPKEGVRLYQRLTDTSTDCSVCAPNAKEQLKHVKEAKEYGDGTLKAAKESKNKRMVAQAEFMLACVATWSLCLQKSKTTEQKKKVRYDLQEKFEALVREPSLNMDSFERQRQIFLGYLAQV